MTVWPSYRYAWQMHRFRRARQLINLAAVLVGWGIRVLPGIAAKIVFDHLSEDRTDGSLGWLWWPIALLAMMAVGHCVVAFTLQSTNGPFAFGNMGMLQRNMLRRILQLPGGQALPSSPGEAVSRFRDDTDAVVWWPIQFNNVIGATLEASIAVFLMWRISPSITLAVVVPLAVVIVTVETARTRIVTYREANRVRTSEVTGFIGDVFTAVQTMQVNHAEQRVVERFRQLNAHRRRAAVRDRMLEEVLKGSFWVINLGTGVVLIFAGRSLQNGSFTVGDLALFVFYLTIFDEFARDIGWGLTGYRQLGVSFKRMQQLMAGRPPQDLVALDSTFEKGPLPSADSPRPTAEPLHELRVKDLAYTHGINGVSFTLPAQSFTVVTGRVGSGKTTLLQSLLGLVPAEGTISWNGTVVDDAPTFMVPPRIGYTPQVPQLFSETLGDNVLLGFDGDLEAAAQLAVLDEDLADLPDGWDTRIGSRGVRLSGGQRQRTAAARMFARRPALLVCDDLSSALDVETEAALWERTLADRSRVVLAVSHRRAALQRADQVIVLKDGRVEDVGPLAELLDRCEEMRRLWRMDTLEETVFRS